MLEALIVLGFWYIGLTAVKWISMSFIGSYATPKEEVEKYFNVIGWVYRILIMSVTIAVVTAVVTGG